MADTPALTAEQIARRDQAFQSCAELLARFCADMDLKTPEQAARDAHMPGGPTVEELVEMVIQLRQKGRDRARPAA